MAERKKAFFIRKKGIAVISALLLLSVFLFGTLARADEKEENPSLYKYYTSVQICPGDTLWEIASEYCEDSSQIKDYMRELKQINHLSNDEIHAGRYLTIIYYSEEYK